MILFVGNRLEQRLTASVVTYLLHCLQDVTGRFRSAQSGYLKYLNQREARSDAFFTSPDFTTIDLNEDVHNYGGGGGASDPNVESFDNFLKTKPNSGGSGSYMEDTPDDQIDQYFQKPVSARITQQQLLLFEEENTKMAEHREQEVTKIVKSIVDLHDIFKDLAGMVQEQGTVLDRIDYNVEQTQTMVSEGYRQLQRAEVYQRKNRKMYCITVLAGVTVLMLVLLIVTKF